MCVCCFIYCSCIFCLSVCSLSISLRVCVCVSASVASGRCVFEYLLFPFADWLSCVALTLQTWMMCQAISRKLNTNFLRCVLFCANRGHTQTHTECATRATEPRCQREWASQRYAASEKESFLFNFFYFIVFVHFEFPFQRLTHLTIVLLLLRFYCRCFFSVLYFSFISNSAVWKY